MPYSSCVASTPSSGTAPTVMAYTAIQRPRERRQSAMIPKTRATAAVITVSQPVASNDTRSRAPNGEYSLQNNAHVCSAVPNIPSVVHTAATEAAMAMVSGSSGGACCLVMMLTVDGVWCRGPDGSSNVVE